MTLVVFLRRLCVMNDKARNRGTVQVGTQVTPELRNRLEAAAAATGVNLSNLIRLALTQFLDRYNNSQII